MAAARLAERGWSPRPTVISARGVVKRYGQTVALAGLDAEIGPGSRACSARTAPARRPSPRCSSACARDGGDLIVHGGDPRGQASRYGTGSATASIMTSPPSSAPRTSCVTLAEIHLLPRRAAMQRANDTLRLVGLGEERFRHIADDVHRPAAAGEARPPRSPTTRSSICSTSRPTHSTPAADGDVRAHPLDRLRVRNAHPSVRRTTWRR